MNSINQTILQETVGEHVFQYSTPSKDLCPPAHSLAFHFVISPRGFCSCLINQAIGKALHPAERELFLITFQLPRLVCASNYVFITSKIAPYLIVLDLHPSSLRWIIKFVDTRDPGKQ